MGNTDKKDKVKKIKYSLIEKYFKINKEQRISRRQFFTRLLMPGILFNIITIFLLIPAVTLLILPLLISKFPIAGIILIPIFIILFWFGLILWITPKLIIKRCHDFGSSGKIEKNIFLIVFISLITAKIAIIGLLFASRSLEFIPSIHDILFYILILLGIYLLFRPGTKGKNNYGEDTSNVALGSLG